MALMLLDLMHMGPQRDFNEMKWLHTESREKKRREGNTVYHTPYGRPYSRPYTGERPRGVTLEQQDDEAWRWTEGQSPVEAHLDEMHRDYGDYMAEQRRHGREPQDREGRYDETWGHEGGHGAAGGYTHGGRYGVPSAGSGWSGYGTTNYESVGFEPERENYEGRGPRNYRRPDDRISDDVVRMLTDHGAIDASEIDVRVSNGEVTLEGHVPTRYEKRLAEDIAWEVEGVDDVHNRLRRSKQ